MQWLRSCCLLHLCVQFVERSFAARTPPGPNVADQRLGLHDAYVRLFGDCQQIIHCVADGNAAAAPVVGKSDLMHASSFNHEWPHAGRDENARFDDSARAHDGCVSAMLNAKLLCHFGRDLAEELRLELGKVSERAAHSTCGVMLGQAIRRKYMRKTFVVWEAVSVVWALLLLSRRIVGMLRIQLVLDYRLQRLVMRRQRTVFQSALNPQPAHAVRMHDE